MSMRPQAEDAFAKAGPPKPPLVQADLIADKAAVRPGETVTVALRQRIKPGWHTYWTNPGDSGEPTRIDWALPEGVTAGPIQWPTPGAIPVGPLVNFGYSGDILLLSDITIPASATGSSVDLAADAKWLVCEQICVPEEAALRLSLPLVGETVSVRPSPNAAAIAAARKALPEPAPWPASFDARGTPLTLKIANAAAQVPAGATVRFFPLEWGKIDHAAPQAASVSGDDLILRLAPGEASKAAQSAPLGGVLSIETRGAGGEIERRGFGINASPAEFAASAADESPLAGTGPPAQGEAPPAFSLALALGFAFLGGLILNLMPCVFPVLSLKALSLARDAENRETRRAKALVYLAGVVTSFIAIAAVIVAIRAGGGAIGWGMQFQSPTFVLAMMALFLAMALKLSGVFTIGHSIAGLGDGLTRSEGLAGEFFTGVLATIVATPCTAPFMGAAIGYAFVQPAPTIFAVLFTLGLGFAAPIVLLSLSPALGRWLPRPGAWMETFKQLMAFPLYATAGWLLWVISVQQGSDGVMAGIVALIGVAFAAWLYGRSHEEANWRGIAAALIAIGAIGLGVISLPEAGQRQTSASALGGESAGPRAEPFTQARLAELTGQNKPVFVNLTAAWCITCKVNERVALRSDRIAEAFAASGIAYLVGDWTNGDPEITALLRTHGRVGVPLYLLYSGAPGSAPEILPQLLTESMILNRLAALATPNKQAKGDL